MAKKDMKNNVEAVKPVVNATVMPVATQMPSAPKAATPQVNPAAAASNKKK